ncbi:hypothetical protein SLS60_009983 [Paraconiothyrium brasiliense]|uniref:Xylanolytic transcriptional activator regulatory domain-containing protein n=1 Tax=Paraconiothyrium brasiliense TaxID=300254 RepID=A0ABR3QTF9_9PLEO
MVVAASKFVPNASISAGDTTQARSRVIVSAMDDLCLESLQALIVIAYTDIGDGNAAKAWSIIGSLTRTVEYSQLAQEREDTEYQPLCQPFEVLDHTSNWTELEERRRIFWNVFNLDRFCSVAMSWSTSLTSADVHRRLPCDGHLWRKEQGVTTPYFGIWDKSAGRMGYPIGFLVEDDGPPPQSNGNPIPDAASSQSPKLADMSNVGAFAYRIEATESMSRVVSYFLQPKVGMRSQQEISAWLTRFKELDLRLVHWKMLLPQKWKSNPNMTRPVPLMDPNLTLAHVTHNTSMILLHQLIAYPPSHWAFRSRLPSSCSVEACYSAGIEIATITQRYLANSPQGCPVASQFAFCIFIAGRMLLVHWRSNPDNDLPNDFWSLVQCLEEMSKRWTGFSRVLAAEQNLSGRYAARLKELYISCVRNEGFQIRVADYTNEITYTVKNAHGPVPQRQPVPLREAYAHPNIHIPSANNLEWHVQQTKPPANAEAFRTMSMDMSQIDNLEDVDLDTLPQIMQDQQYVNMDRIIAFDDGSMFAGTVDTSMF